MSKIHFMTSLCASAIVSVFALSHPALAQGTAMSGPPAMASSAGTEKLLGENDKVRVVDYVAKPGDVSPMQARPMRIIYVIKGGTLERTYADGTKEAITNKAGETKILTEKRPYSYKITGTSALHMIAIYIK